MKLQGISVVFALIVLPLILVLIYYIQLQVDTIDAQNKYDVKLLNSTYGAMSAFEINTANEDLSSVSDSLRTIIDASTNIFFNTLSTNLGMSNASRSYVEPYIPALLYTLYDGYYISAPTRTPKILIDTDGNAVSVGDVGVTISGSTISYKEVHTSLESQSNCTNCISTRDPDTGRVTACTPGSENHIIFDSYDAPDQPEEYSKMTAEQQCNYYVKYGNLTTDKAKESYGQLIYIKRKADPSEADSYTTDVNEAEYEIKHILKTYMPYSARYKDTNFDVTVVYSLDNYVKIEGTIGEVYYTKSGYLIPEDSVKVLKTESTKIKEDGTPENVTKTGTDAQVLLSYNQNVAKEFIYNGNYVEIELVDGTIISSGSQRKSYNAIEEEIRGLEKNLNLDLSYIAQFPSMNVTDKEKVEEFVNKLLSPESVAKYGSYDLSGAATLFEKLLLIKGQITQKINERQYQLDEMSSVSYYVTAQIFSNWIHENLGKEGAPYKIEEKDLIEISGQSYKLIKGQTEVSHDFSESTGSIFNILGKDNIDVSNLNSPMEIDTDSTFYSHKLNVIRDSIQYNLNLAMSTYNKMLISTNDYAMPVMENEEWEKILNNVSIVSFMQGYNCGLKKYSNYKIVSSTNNEISVSPRELYYVEKTDFSNENAEYHRIDCPRLFELDSGTTNSYIAFLSKEVKYDKIYDKANAQLPYKYDHKNLACYECINDGNYKNIKLFDSSESVYSSCDNLRKAYHIAVGKARNNLYKMNAIENSQGYEILYDGAVVKATSTYSLAQIKSVEVVLNTIKTRDSEENVLNYKVNVGAQELNKEIFTIVPNVTTKTTLKIDVDQTINSASKVGITSLDFVNIFDHSTAYSDKASTESIPDFKQKSAQIVRDSIEFIRVIYR